ncbi:hypothetical protein, partial [Siminovitchia fortis]|uniref:hypothetical protein n=1 Tax=Siminovitchia fortis TaxID=254758 RepID=UPI001C9315BE
VSIGVRLVRVCSVGKKGWVEDVKVFKIGGNGGKSMYMPKFNGREVVARLVLKFGKYVFGVLM